MHLIADITTNDNYKAWVSIQASAPLGFSKYKRTQMLLNEYERKKQKHN